MTILELKKKDKGKELVLINKLIVAKDTKKDNLDTFVQDAYNQVKQNPKSKYNL